MYLCNTGVIASISQAKEY